MSRRYEETRFKPRIVKFLTRSLRALALDAGVRFELIRRLVEAVSSVRQRLRGIYVFTVDDAGATRFQALILNPSPRPSDDPQMPDPHVRDYSFATQFIVRGDDLFATASLYDADTNTSEERLLLFRRRGSTWSLRQTLAPRGSVRSLALDRGALLVGSAAGVEVFRKWWDGGYYREAVLHPPEGAEESGFGAPLALDWNTALVGARNDSDGIGAVYVYERYGWTWRRVQKLTPPEAVTDTGFGTALSVDAFTIAVGAPYAAGLGPSALGAVHLYSRWGWWWLPGEVLLRPIAEPSHPLAFGVAVDLEGPFLLAGSFTGDPGASAPEAYLYRRTFRGASFETTLDAARVNAVRLSGKFAFVDSVGARGGSYPRVLPLPPL